MPVTNGEVNKASQLVFASRGLGRRGEGFVDGASQFVFASREVKVKTFGGEC
jgi:hypothetical protein